MDHFKAPVLLLGYNRPDEFAKRLREIISWSPPRVYISIDGPKFQKDELLVYEVYNLALEFEKLENVTIHFHKTNLGLSKHITSAISKVLEGEKHLVIIEDDVQMSFNVYSSISYILTNREFKNIGIVGGFSALPSVFPFFESVIKNKWRPTVRINIWGWGIRKEIWALYERDLSKFDYLEYLKVSKNWRTLSGKQKNIWLGRFNKVAQDPDFTWDYQVQYLSLRYDLENYLPRYRAVDNVGFNNVSGTNNRNRKSRYYFGYTNKQTINGFSRNTVFNWVNIKLELMSDSVPSISNKILKFTKKNF